MSQNGLKGLVVAGTHSGAGKTTLSLALMAAFARRGLVVQAFKVGPDFIDPGHHTAVTGRPSHNLDGWMLSPGENRDIFARRSAGADLALVEGVMGLYDGFEAVGEAGSTSQMAKLLGLPVLLTVDARSVARSFAALVGGFLRFDPELTWAGVAANRVGGAAHLDILREALTLVPEAVLLGGLKREPAIGLAERHLGLITAEDGAMSPETVETLVRWVEDGLDLDRLWDSLPAIQPGPVSDPAKPTGDMVRMGVARDRAFCFCYQENLSRLEAAGAELCFFSPLSDPRLPEGVRGLYLPGGYPELHAETLSANREMLGEIAQAAEGGMPVYAECGGMMYLGREVAGLDGKSRPMAGVLPLRFRMLERLRSLGYREAVFTRDTILGPAGTMARGHEFHYSEVSHAGEAPGFSADAYRLSGRKGPVEHTFGYRRGNVLAAYVHLHLGSNPTLAPALVDACRNWRI